MTPWSMFVGSKHSRLVALKSKMHVTQNWPKNIRHFFNFHQNFLIFFWWKVWQIIFFPFFVSSLEHIFLQGSDAWKMKDLFQRPLGPISIILNFSKNILVKAEITQLSSKLNLRSFDENWRDTSNICIWWAAQLLGR